MPLKRKQTKLPTGLSIARAALEGASREGLVKQALEALVGGGGADRLGIWLRVASVGSEAAGQMAFHGATLAPQRTMTPGDWCGLPADAPVPWNQLSAGKTVRQRLPASSLPPALASFTRLNALLWVPIYRPGCLLGVVLGGARKTDAVLPQEQMESVAAEISLALVLDREQEKSRNLMMDVKFCGEVLSRLAGGETSGTLSRIVESCTASVAAGGLGAQFAAVARAGPSLGHSHEAADTFDFAWKSGPPEWLDYLESDDLAALGRRALRSGYAAGTEAPSRRTNEKTGDRVLAVPLNARGTTQGLMIVGFGGAETSLAVLERLELRAPCASAALAFRLNNGEGERRVARATEVEPSGIAHRPTEHRLSAEFLTLSESLGDGVVLFDAQNRIRAINSRFAELSGLTLEAVKKFADFEELVAVLSARAAEPEVFATRWRELAASPGSGLREEVHLATPVSRLLERTAHAVTDAGGEQTGRIELYRDVTEQNAVRSRLLHMEKLAALGELVSGVAHELSNPLTSIVGYAQRLLVRQREVKHREEIRRIFAEAERASAILRQMLLTAREMPLERSRISINDVVRRTVELQRFALAAEGIGVELDLDPLGSTVTADAGRLQQVLLNLLGNARQALENRKRDAMIRVTTKHRDGGKRARIEISDNGPGIPKEILSRIFDPFFTTKPAGAGTGLGLAIVRGIVREHGGEVHVSSSQGAGAIFTIDLPTSSQDEARRATSGPTIFDFERGTVPARNFATLRHVGVGTRTVLVVEDEPTVAQLIADVLHDEGFRVDTASNAREARRRAATEEFDLVICDMKMPDFDGAQFYQALERAKNPLRHKFLFVTGDVLAGHTRKFLDESGILYLAKPFRVEELMEKVGQVLDGGADFVEVHGRKQLSRGSL